MIFCRAVRQDGVCEQQRTAVPEPAGGAVRARAAGGGAALQAAAGNTLQSCYQHPLPPGSVKYGYFINSH